MKMKMVDQTFPMQQCAKLKDIEINSTFDTFRPNSKYVIPIEHNNNQNKFRYPL